MHRQLHTPIHELLLLRVSQKWKNKLLRTSRARVSILRMAFSTFLNIAFNFYDLNFPTTIITSTSMKDTIDLGDQGSGYLTVFPDM